MLATYSGVQIKMLFMPNGAGSKPHVSFTRKSKMDILRAFCVELNAKFATPAPAERVGDVSRIKFYVCDFEYWLCTSGAFTPSPEDINNPASIKTDEEYDVYTNHSPLTTGRAQGFVGQATAAQGASDIVKYISELLFHDNYGDVLKKNDTATFRTLPVLRSAFPEHRIVLGMGLDNMLQLIYWKNLNVYKQFNVVGFYAVNRVLTAVEEASTAIFQGQNFQARLQKVMPWSITGNVLIDRFGSDATIKCGENESAIGAGDIYGSNCAITSGKVAIQIPPLTQMDDTPPPTSSTTMREMIYYYLINKSDPKYFDFIKKIMFGPDNVI